MNSTFVENVKKKIAKSTYKGGPRKSNKTKKKVAIRSSDLVPGTVYVGHIPHGFYEEEMKKYFSQFGKIIRIRVARSRKTGNCKGFGYIQFQSEEVAKIVAESMNNYLFFEKLLKCEFIPSDKLNLNVFNGWRSQVFLSSDKNRIKQNRPKTEERLKKSKTRRLGKLRKLKSMLKEKEIKFNIKAFIPKEK